MIGVIAFLFWCGFLCLCGFDSIGNQVEKGKLREEAKRKGQATYWFNGKMFHTATNKRCYLLTDDNTGDALIRDAKTGNILCNQSEINREIKKATWEKIKKQEEVVKKFDNLSDEDKTKIRTKIAATRKEKQQKEIDSKIKGLKSSLYATLFISIIGILMFVMIGLQNGFEPFIIKLIIAISIFDIVICAIPYFQIKKIRDEYKEV